MKKTVILSVCFLFIFAMFTGCGGKISSEVNGDQDSKKSAIVGVWKTGIIEFNGNKVCFIDYFAKDGFLYPVQQRINPSQSPIGGKKVSYTFDGEKLIIDNKEKHFELTQDILTRIDDNGTRTEFKRTKSPTEKDILELFKEEK